MFYQCAMKINNDIDDSVIKKLSEVISDERRGRASKYVKQKDKIRCILAEVVLRYELYRHYKIKDKIIFNYNNFGKPFLKDYDNIFFNISHSDDWVLCGVGDVPIGVDIEHITQCDMEIARRFLGEKEYAYLLNLDAEHRAISFFKMWTLKESYVKEVGEGLNIPLNSFTFDFVNNSILLRDQNGLRKDLHFAVGKISDSYCYATCVRSENKIVINSEILIVTLQQLLEFIEIYK